MSSSKYWKEMLQLTAHPEGGAYRRIYQSQLTIPQVVLTPAHKGPRYAATSIYFLLEHGEFSAFHRIASDELWHFYDGTGLVIYEIDPQGQLATYRLGRNAEAGEVPFAVVPAGSWFGCRVEVPGGFALCGCTVAPGFDFEDFELAQKDTLAAEFPQHTDIIASLALP